MHHWEHAQAQRLIQAEAAAQLRCHERMQRLLCGSATEQIHSTTPQLARARPGKDELKPLLLLDHQMCHLQQLGQLLHLIDHHMLHARLAGHALTQALRTSRHRA